MLRRAPALSLILALAALACWGARPAQAQDQAFARDIAARGRVFPEVGPGISAIKRDAAGRYYVLAAPATAVLIYGADGNRAGQIPNANSKSARIVYASDIDLDAEGRLFVADRGANAVKAFRTDGSLLATVPVPAPLSIAALSGGEFAVTSLRADKLVSIYNAQGTLERTFGDIPAPAEGGERGALFTSGRLYGDGAGQIHFVFTDLPDPTIRKYDRFGYAAYEISLPASEFKPPREAKQWTTVTIGKGQSAPPKPVIQALAVDPETREVWAAIGDELLHFDKDGTRRSAYHMTTKAGTPIEAAAILVEHDRILVGDDPNGIFDFAYPESRHAGAVSH